MKSTSKDDVNKFLKELQAMLSVGQLLFASRAKNTQTLIDLELTPKQREEVITKIVLEDYSEGPLKNDQYGDEPMWVFGKIIDAKEIYIKITITKMNVICISFHTSQYSMNYPFK